MKSKRQINVTPTLASDYKFFHFNQNNSGGEFVFDKKRGLTHHVVIQAKDCGDANSRAESIGIYFNGVDDGRDCHCCGDRWNECSYRDGAPVPKVHAELAENYSDIFFNKNAVAIHYIDGSFKFIETAKPLAIV